MALKAHLDYLTDNAGDERGHERRRLLLETSGTLPSGEEANVSVHNISQTGMLLETTLPLEEGEALSVDLPQAGTVEARVVWKSGLLFGCQFSGPVSDGALSAAELRASAPLAPAIGRPATARQVPSELFGKRLEQLRKGQSLTLAQVADALGVSKPTVWAWEKGKARPIADRMPALAEVLGIAEDELAHFNEPPGIGELVEASRVRIAEAYGTTADRVKIMIEV